MKRKSPFDHHDKGKKKALVGSVSLTDKEKKNYDTHKQRENSATKRVTRSSSCLCGICFDLKPASDTFGGSKCNYPFWADCISKHVPAKIHQNVLNVNCPNPECDVELEAQYLQPILSKQVIDRWELASSIDLSQKLKRSEGQKDLEMKFLELATKEMWQKCPKCSFYCEHMTCRCGCNFCYQCGNNWRHGHLCNSHQPT